MIDGEHAGQARTRSVSRRIGSPGRVASAPMLDLDDLDHLRLIAAEIAPHV
jgi:hypothetical protein